MEKIILRVKDITENKLLALLIYLNFDIFYERLSTDTFILN